MRTSHPGCGSSNSRHGYRSNGQYVDGWFGGTCGTGSTYYLFCTNCRKRYTDKEKEKQYLSALPERYDGRDNVLLYNKNDMIQHNIIQRNAIQYPTMLHNAMQ